MSKNIKFGFNYYEKIIELFEQRFPEKRCTIWFSSNMATQGRLAIYNDGKGGMLELDKDACYEKSVYALIHYLAHLATGLSGEEIDSHTKEWYEIRDWLTSECTEAANQAMEGRETESCPVGEIVH